MYALGCRFMHKMQQYFLILEQSNIQRINWSIKFIQSACESICREMMRMSQKTAFVSSERTPETMAKL